MQCVLRPKRIAGGLLFVIYRTAAIFFSLPVKWKWLPSTSQQNDINLVSDLIGARGRWPGPLGFDFKNFEISGRAGAILARGLETGTGASAGNAGRPPAKPIAAPPAGANCGIVKLKATRYGVERIGKVAQLAKSSPPPTSPPRIEMQPLQKENAPRSRTAGSRMTSRWFHYVMRRWVARILCAQEIATFKK